MPVAISCPSCSARINAPDTAAGRSVACPRCKASLTVPQVSPAPKPAAGPTTSGEDAFAFGETAPSRRRRPRGGKAGVVTAVVAVAGVLLLAGGGAWYFVAEQKRHEERRLLEEGEQDEAIVRYMFAERIAAVADSGGEQFRAEVETQRAEMARLEKEMMRNWRKTPDQLRYAYYQRHPHLRERDARR